jgi:Uma2 family endonuclease
LDKVSEKGIFTPPALVVEVISKSNYKKLREAKKQEYANFGVAEYWEIYPKKRKINVEILNENEDGTKNYTSFSSASKTGKIQSKVLEGFELAMEDVFDVRE